MNEKMPLQRDVHVISVVAQAVALQRDELDGQGQMEWIETEWMGDIAESLGATHCLAFFFFSHIHRKGLYGTPLIEGPNHLRSYFL